jgi:DNA-binding beta-propeller fold protein YncE
MKNSLPSLGSTLGSILGALLVVATAQAQAPTAHKLTKVWESEPALKVPESVRFDAKRKVLYVSNIDGEPWTADGKGSIAKVGLDGKIIAAEWVTGLDCPKGLALSADGKWLYAADAGGIVVIDVKKGKIKKKIAIPEGVQLNDLVAGDKDTLYVSDSKGKKVFVVKDGKASVYLDETVLKGPNGLLVHNGSLYVLDNNSLNRVEADKSLKVLADGMPGGVDGLENVNGEDFLVSVWSGAVWYVNADGSKELLFDGKAVQTSTADIGWDPATKTVYAPTFFKNSVIAFKVE